jgi:hypothetical protein
MRWNVLSVAVLTPEIPHLSLHVCQPDLSSVRMGESQHSPMLPADLPGLYLGMDSSGISQASFLNSWNFSSLLF